MTNIFMCLNTAKDMYLAAQAKNYLDKKGTKYNFDYYDFDLESNWAKGPAHLNFFSILTNFKKNRDLIKNIDFNNELHLNKVIEFIKSLVNYDVYCFSFWDSYVDIHLLMALYIRKYNPKAKILFGGPDIILRPFLGKILKKIGFDYTFGDVDVSLYNYISDYSNFYNKKHIKSMNLLTSEDVPKYSSDEIEYLDRDILASTSRGCANKCRFCSSPALSPYSFVPRNIIGDWFKYYNSIGVSRCSFTDSTLNKVDFDIFLDSLISINNKISIYKADVSFRDLKLHQIPKMKEANFIDVSFGFECLHPILQKNINKKMPSIDTIFRFLEELQRCNIGVKLFYIAGIPTQTDEIFYDELEVIEEVNRLFNNVHFEFYDYFVSPLSYIHKNPKEFGVNDTNHFSRFIEDLPEFKNEILDFKWGYSTNPSEEKTMHYMRELYSKINKKTKMSGDNRFI